MITDVIEQLQDDSQALVAAGLPQKLAIRNIVAELEQALFKQPDHFEGDCFPLKHTFCDGIYVRQIFLPKGSLIIGKIHKHEHPFFITVGEVSVLTEKGSEHIQAPYAGTSPAGTKRVVYAHEDTLWHTVHRTDSTDLATIESEIIAPSFAALEEST